MTETVPYADGSVFMAARVVTPAPSAFSNYSPDAAAPTAPTPERARPLFWMTMLLLVAAAVEAASLAIASASGQLLVEPIRRRASILKEQSERIAILLDSTRTTRDVLDSVLGWRYRAGYASSTENINRQGLRSRREYDSVPSPGTLRVAAFGNSFVYGHEVSDTDAWSALIESRSAGVEVLNYGVGGYGLDQAFLRFQQEGLSLKPSVALIGFHPDDLRRVTNRYRRFISTREWPLGKPRFLLSSDHELVLLPNPLAHRADYERLLRDPGAVRELGAFDEWYSRAVYEHPLYDALATIRLGHAFWQRASRRLFDEDRLMAGGVFNARSSAFRVQVGVLRAFVEAARGRGVAPVVLMLPNPRSVERSRRGEETEYRALEDSLRGGGVVVWDGALALRDVPAGVEELFAPGAHYSPRGSRALAAWLSVRLDSIRLLVDRAPARAGKRHEPARRSRT